MEPFYQVSVSVLRLGGTEQVSNHYYKSIDKADEHIAKERENRIKDGFRVVSEMANAITLRNENWTEISLQLTECYFED